eukprot:349735-Chlamydomonas_euryale.AAC.2
MGLNAVVKLLCNGMQQNNVPQDMRMLTHDTFLRAFCLLCCLWARFTKCAWWWNMWSCFIFIMVVLVLFASPKGPQDKPPYVSTSPTDSCRMQINIAAAI